MQSDTRRPTLLTRCLQLNALALAFSLSHVIADIAILNGDPGGSWWVLYACIIASTVYGWWGWMMAQAAVGSRAALKNLLALCGIWAVLQGATVVFTPITEILADVIHFGCLLFGAWGAYATWRALRGGR